MKDLYPGVTYTVNVSAYTDMGNGPAATIVVTTIPLGMYIRILFIYSTYICTVFNYLYMYVYTVCLYIYMYIIFKNSCIYEYILLM